MAQEGDIKRRLGRGMEALLGGFGTAPKAPAVVVQPVVPSAADLASQAATLHVGLAAIAATEEPDSTDSHSDLLHVSVSEITRNPFQPRTEFDEASLKELSDSIQQHGVLQPVLVRKLSEGGYQLIAGERRWLAAQKAGLATVPCRVMTLADQAVCEAALEENMKRRDLNVLEKATAFKGYVDRFGCTIEELGKRLSLDRSTVSNMMRLLELPEAIKSLLLEEKITAGHAKAILALEESHQVALCERIQNERLSVRETEAAVRKLMQDPEVPETLSFENSQQKTKSDDVQPTAHVQSLEQQFRDLLGLKVQIKLKTKDTGQVVIDFNSNDDFQRLTRMLRKVA